MGDESIKIVGRRQVVRMKTKNEQQITKTRKGKNTKEEGGYRRIGAFSCLPIFVLSWLGIFLLGLNHLKFGF
jgi:hypothetical protein